MKLFTTIALCLGMAATPLAAQSIDDAVDRIEQQTFILDRAHIFFDSLGTIKIMIDHGKHRQPWPFVAILDNRDTREWVEGHCPRPRGMGLDPDEYCKISGVAKFNFQYDTLEVIMQNIKEIENAEY